MNTNKFIHLPKKGYYFEAIDSPDSNDISWGVKKVYNPNYKGSYTLQGFALCDFVHGDYESLCTGKMCVIRDNIQEINDSATKGELVGTIIVEKAVVHLNDGGAILFLGLTKSGNSKIVYKK